MSLDSRFPRSRHYTQIAIAYRNPEASYIADQVLPRVPVGKLQFEYDEYPLEHGYDLPDTRVGERDAMNEIDVSSVRKLAKCEDQGVQTRLAQDDIDQAPEGVDPRERATERVTDVLLRRREVRVAGLVMNPALYTNKETVVAADKWTAATSHPLVKLARALDVPAVRPNVLVLGRAAATTLLLHKDIVSATQGNSGEHGYADLGRLAAILGLSEILIGDAHVNTAKPGKPATLARAWGNHALLLHRDSTVQSPLGGLTFGITAEFGGRQAGAKDVDMGVRGGVVVRAWESVREVIMAPAAAYFFEGVI